MGLINEGLIKLAWVLLKKYPENACKILKSEKFFLIIAEVLNFSVHNVLLGSFHLYNGKIIEKTHNSACSPIRL